jgi:signal transduction histidine kinase
MRRRTRRRCGPIQFADANMLRLKVYDGHPASTVVLPEVSVSRRHARIERTGNFFLIRDEGSTNGTFVNEMLVRTHVLSHGDSVRIGKYVLVADSRPASKGDTTRVRVTQLSLPESIFGDESGEGGGAAGAPAGAGLWDAGRERLFRLFEIGRELGHVDAPEVLLARSLDIILEELEADRGALLLAEAGSQAAAGPGARGAKTGKARAGKAAKAGLSFSPAAVRTRGESSPSREEAKGAREKGEASGDDGRSDSRAAPAAKSEDLVIPEAFLVEACARAGGLAGEVPAASGKGEARRSCIAAPVKDRDALLAVIYVDREPGGPAFRQTDLHFLRALASQVAVSLANARLFREMQETREEVEAIVSNLTDGVLVADDRFQVVEANRAATVLLGLRDRNPLGASLPSLFEGFQAFPERATLEALSRGEGGVFYLRPARKQGEALETTLIAGKIAPYPRSSPERRGVVVTLRDHSAAQHVEELKTQFAEKVAHKLRSPLTVVQGDLPFLRQSIQRAGGGTASEREMIEELERNCSLLRRLIDEFVEFIELETRCTRLSTLPQPADVRALLRDAVRSVEPAATKKGIAIVERSGSVLPPLAVYSDLLLRAFQEILKNAVAFNREGGAVAIEAREIDGCVRIDFIDTGPGIPAGEIESVFYVCHQVDAERTGQVPGAGLGLTIARHVVQKHGGEISITSPFGFADRGTRVSVYLPEPDWKSDAAPEPAAGRGEKAGAAGAGPARAPDHDDERQDDLQGEAAKEAVR